MTYINDKLTTGGTTIVIKSVQFSGIAVYDADMPDLNSILLTIGINWTKLC